MKPQPAPTVERSTYDIAQKACDDIRAAAEREARRDLATVVHLYLGGKPILCNTLIEGNVITAKQDGSLTIKPHPTGDGAETTEYAWGAHTHMTPMRLAPKPKRPYRRTSAGRARQIKALKAYWAKRRAQKGKGK